MPVCKRKKFPRTAATMALARQHMAKGVDVVREKHRTRMANGGCTARA